MHANDREFHSIAKGVAIVIVIVALMSNIPSVLLFFNYKQNDEISKLAIENGLQQCVIHNGTLNEKIIWKKNCE